MYLTFLERETMFLLSPNLPGCMKYLFQSSPTAPFVIVLLWYSSSFVLSTLPEFVFPEHMCLLLLKECFSWFIHPKVAFPLFLALPEVRPTACEKKPGLVFNSVAFTIFNFIWFLLLCTSGSSGFFWEILSTCSAAKADGASDWLSGLFCTDCKLLLSWLCFKMLMLHSVFSMKEIIGLASA